MCRGVKNRNHRRMTAAVFMVETSRQRSLKPNSAPSSMPNRGNREINREFETQPLTFSNFAQTWRLQLGSRELSGSSPSWWVNHIDADTCPYSAPENRHSRQLTGNIRDLRQQRRPPRSTVPPVRRRRASGAGGENTKGGRSRPSRCRLILRS